MTGLLSGMGYVYADTNESALYIDEKGNIVIGASVKAKSFETDAGVSLSAIQNAVNMLMPIGTILAYGGDTSNKDVVQELVGQGWLPCDGRSVDRKDYNELFNAISTSFGAGDTRTTFQVPDFRGRFLRGADQSTKRDPDAGSRRAEPGGGNSGDKVGSVQEDELKKHSHRYSAPLGWTDQKSNQMMMGTWTTLMQTWNTTECCGEETRPKNVYVNWIIKAKHLLPLVPKP